MTVRRSRVPSHRALRWLVAIGMATLVSGLAATHLVAAPPPASAGPSSPIGGSEAGGRAVPVAAPAQAPDSNTATAPPSSVEPGPPTGRRSSPTGAIGSGGPADAVPAAASAQAPGADGVPAPRAFAKSGSRSGRPAGPSEPGDPAEAVPAAAATKAPGSSAAPTPIALEALRNNQVHVPITGRLTSLVGLLAMVFIAWLISSNRRLVPWRIIFVGLGLQTGFGMIMFWTDAGRIFFESVKDAVMVLLGFANEGARFVFGDLVDSVPFAFSVLPTIIFFSSLMTVLYHLGVMQAVVSVLARIMQATMKTSGAESLSAAGNIFVGQTEAPLLVKPYVDSMTRSELMTVMVGGFATVAGGVMASYIAMFGHVFPDIAGHLLTASIMSAPAALVIAKVMVPEEATPVTAGKTASGVSIDTANVVDAAARGAGEGLHLALNVGAMLLAFVALVALVNYLVGAVGGLVGAPNLTLQQIAGVVLAPVAWLMGVPWADASEIGALLGVKTVLNEFVAYGMMVEAIGNGTITQPRSVVIAIYALCGFANFGSIAIQIGGIGSIAPKRRSDLARLGLRAMIGGTLAAFMTATVAGMLL